MSVIILLLVASISVSAIFLAGFIWSVRHKQYDDDYSPPRRMLFDDKPGGVGNRESAVVNRES